MILIPTKSVTFAHSGLVFMDKSSTDGEEQLPSSLTGGRPNLQPSNPYLQKATIQPYRRPTHSAASNPTLQQAPHSAANHPNPAAEATDAAGPIIRDYGITN